MPPAEWMGYVFSCGCGSERESTGEHNRSTVTAVGSCDIADAWVGSRPGGQRGWIEAGVRILEGWMVEDVFPVHPKLEFGSLPSGQTPTLGH